MTSPRIKQQRAEYYARALADAALAEDRLNQDMVQLRHAVKFSPEVLAILGIMYEKGDLDLLPEITREYNEILDAEESTVLVTATTAVEMDDDLRERVRARMEEKLGKKVYLVERIDPSIIGGIVIEAQGDRQDASVRAQLANVHKTLSSVYLGSDGE